MRYLALLCLLSFPAWATLTHESELAVVAAGGNSDLQTINAATKNKYQTQGKSTYLFGGHYTYGEAEGALSARNWDVNGKYEFALTEKLSAILAETIEGNNFQDVKARYNTDLGAKYSLIKDDKQDWFLEAAYRYTIEDSFSTANVYQQKARAYTEWSRKQSETIQWKLWLEYLPNFTDGRDWMMTGEASMTSILTSTFSLKLAYKGLYDNLPAASGLKNYDYITTTSLVAKF
jgi:putative salt-induced outer membrane protein